VNTGMTLKQAAREIDTEDGKQRFLILSVQIHAAKSRVPKRLWSLVNKALREGEFL
jgi:hypothetical protein